MIQQFLSKTNQYRTITYKATYVHWYELFLSYLCPRSCIVKAINFRKVLGKSGRTSWRLVKEWEERNPASFKSIQLSSNIQVLSISCCSHWPNHLVRNIKRNSILLSMTEFSSSHFNTGLPKVHVASTFRLAIACATSRTATPETRERKIERRSLLPYKRQRPAVLAGRMPS